MKGIILAGGAGSRLYPLTKIITKQLQPVYEKPMIYYPLSTLMLCGIKDILLITTPHDQIHFQNLLGDGKNLGLNIQYEIQDEPKGLPQAFTIGEKFIDGDNVALMLGDNLFYGDFHGFRRAVENQVAKEGDLNARVFAYKVLDPERYGVVEFDENGKVLSLEEKPQNPKSNYAVPGFYLFDGTVSERAKNLKPSTRGELEIVDLIRTYLNEDKLGTEVIGRGIAWLDTGTPQSFLEASNFIGAIEQRQGLKVACIEEIAFRMGFIDAKGFEAVIESTPKSPYRGYLQAVLEESNV